MLCHARGFWHSRDISRYHTRHGALSARRGLAIPATALNWGPFTDLSSYAALRMSILCPVPAAESHTHTHTLSLVMPCTCVPVLVSPSHNAVLPRNPVPTTSVPSSSVLPRHTASVCSSNLLRQALVESPESHCRGRVRRVL